MVTPRRSTEGTCAHSISDEILETIFVLVNSERQRVDGGSRPAPACDAGSSGGCAASGACTSSGPCTPQCAAATCSMASSGTEGGASSCSSACSASTTAAPRCSASAVLPLVCRRWRHVWHTSPLLHGTLSLDLARLESQAALSTDSSACTASSDSSNSSDELRQQLTPLLRLLQRRGQAARRLWLHSEGSVLRMADVLQGVSPKLQAAYLGAGAPADSLHLLRSFTALRSLDLPASACVGQLAAEGSSCLRVFDQLRELTVREGAAPGLLSSLACLPRLRLLSLTVTEATPMGGLHRQLGGLRALEELHLYLSPAVPTMFDFQPGALGALTSLRSVLLISTNALCSAVTVGPGLSSLPSLQELQVDSRVAALPSDLWACQQLTRLDLDLHGSAPLPPAPSSYAGAGATSSLPALQELRLTRCRLPGGVLPDTLCQLGGLTQLEVQRCGLSSGCTPWGVAPQLCGLPNLRHLSLEDNALCTLPPWVAALPELCHLDCSHNPLASLPLGPYLVSLETLLLSATCVTKVPPVLCAARQLEVLDLSGNPGLELSSHDVHDTLARMPSLSLLLLGKQAACLGAAAEPGPEWRPPSMAAMLALGRAMPQLQVDFEHTAAEFEGI